MRNSEKQLWKAWICETVFGITCDLVVVKTTPGLAGPVRAKHLLTTVAVRTTNKVKGTKFVVFYCEQVILGEALLLIGEATPMKVQEARLLRATRVTAPSNTGNRAEALTPSREKRREAENPPLAAKEQHL